MTYYNKRLVAAQLDVVTVIKAARTRLLGYYIYNPNAVVSYVQLFDTAGTVTLGTTVPDLSLGIPPNGGANVTTDGGVSFQKGLQIAATTTPTGLTAPGVGLSVNLYYE